MAKCTKVCCFVETKSLAYVLNSDKSIFLVRKFVIYIYGKVAYFIYATEQRKGEVQGWNVWEEVTYNQGGSTTVESLPVIRTHRLGDVF